jgi:hypothetical protein
MPMPPKIAKAALFAIVSIFTQIFAIKFTEALFPTIDRMVLNLKK